MKIVTFSNPLSKALGLRFKKAAPETLYVFDFKRPVSAAFSMWFVFHPIDIYFLDEKKRVVDRKLGFKPFTTYRPRTRYRYAVETAPGMVQVPKQQLFPHALK